VLKPLLTHSIPFSTSHPPEFFAQFPAAPAVFVLRGADAAAEPYVSKTANLRRRLLRLLQPAESQSKRLNLRERVATIEYSLTESDFESVVLLYRTLREAFPESYQKRLRLRPAPVVRLNLENEYPRAYVTTRVGKLSGRSHYYGPFRSRAVAEKFLNDSLDLFKMRRCTFNLNPDPAFPGCVYSEMKMCLAPCFKGCTDEEYAAEVRRVQDYLDSGGESLLQELESARERLSEATDFEGAAAQHAKVTKVKGILSACDDICSRLDRLDAAILQPSSTPNAVALFRFYRGALTGPVKFTTEAEDQAATESAPVTRQEMETRLSEALDSLASSGTISRQRFGEELAILKRWYYRSHRVGEIFFANEQGELPIRRIMRGVTRIANNEKEVEEAQSIPENSIPNEAPTA
jgi:excinuclease UvrABC nuclease subunit